MSGLPLRSDLIGAVPYGAPVDAVPVRLNVNENPYAPPAAVVDAMAQAVAEVLADVNRYPDREALDLRAALADYLGNGLTAENIWPANGSNEVMHQILGAFGGPGRTVLSFTPTYSMYPLYARDTNTTYATVPRAADHSLDFAAAESAIGRLRPTIVVLDSPNNPTGTPLRPDDVRRLHELVRATGVLVVDEAYAEFAPAEDSAVRLIESSPRLIVTRTLSKAFGLAGLRVGYAATGPDIVDALRIVRLPYHLSATTQAAAAVAVRRSSELLSPVAEVVAERESMATWFADRGIGVAHSRANFLFAGPFDDSHAVFESLLERGVLVRETSVPGFLRASMGTPAENAALRKALAAVLPLADREETRA